MLSITEGDILIMKSGTDSWLEAQVGMTLELGDTIKAGDDSRAVITFFEGSTIELEAGTEISVTELSTAIDTGSTTISLKQEIGKTISRVEKLADPASRYEVETPGAVAVVRGSIMHVYVDLQGGTTVGCEAGNVTATTLNVTVWIPVGTQRYAKAGGSFGDAVPIGSPLPDEDEDDEDEYRSGGGGGGGGGGRRTTAAIAIAKTANTTQVAVGHNVTYTYIVTNPGDLSLSDVSVTDDKVSVTWIFTATYTVTDEDSDPLVNVATASGSYARGRTVTDRAEASVDILSSAIAIAKAANCTEAREGDKITYTYNVTNTGNTPLSNISVSDDKAGDAAYQSGDTNSDGQLDVDETWIFTATYTVTEEDTDPLVNVATASGTDASGKAVNAPASASVAIVVYSIRIELTWNATADMDLHFIRPEGVFWHLVDDCHWRNVNPDWGEEGVVEDNPVYSGDDRDGYGPENVYLKLAYEEGIYHCKVRYCPDEHTFDLGPCTATVVIWINGVQVAEYSKELSWDEVWDCASIEWPSGVVTPA
jgi:hypothetical protein